MNNKDYARLTYPIIMFLIVILGACQKPIPEPSSPTGDIQIHLSSLSYIVESTNAGEKLDILNKPQYIILDDQIQSYDWSQQIITFDSFTQGIYIEDANFLTWPSDFAVVWNGKIVAEGKILDTRSPIRSKEPVIYVIEPRNDSEFPVSAYRSLSEITPDIPVKKLSIILNMEGEDFIFDPEVAKEIKEYFNQTGRLID